MTPLLLDDDCASRYISPKLDSQIDVLYFRFLKVVFDVCDHDHPLPKADITIAADVMYEPDTGIAMAHRAVEALQAGSRVIIGCSPGRKGRPFFEKELQNLLPELNVKFFEAKGTTGITSIDSTCSEIQSVALIDLIPEEIYLNSGRE